MTHLANIVVADVPVRAVSDVKSRPVLLHYHTRHHILEGFTEVMEFLHAPVAYCVYPVGDLAISNNRLYGCGDRPFNFFARRRGGVDIQKAACLKNMPEQAGQGEKSSD